MSMSMLNAIGSANQSISQFMFLGSNEWALADAATLNLLASGTTSVNLAAGVTGGFAAPGVFLGLSGPSSVGGNAFAFQINANTGAFTTYDLPSDFPYLTSFSGVITSTPVASSNSNVWVVSAKNTNSDGTNSFLNLSQVCGLVSGGVSIINPPLSAYVTSIPLTTPSSIYTINDGGYLFSIDIASGAIVLTNEDFISDYPSPSGAVGVYIFVLSRGGRVLLLEASGTNPYILDSTTYPAMISVENAFAFGDNLFLLNYTNNQAQSVNLANPASPQFSPVFPLDLSSSGTAPGFSWMDPSTGVYYQNVSGASTFANLSPMQF